MCLLKSSLGSVAVLSSLLWNQKQWPRAVGSREWDFRATSQAMSLLSSPRAWFVQGNCFGFGNGKIKESQTAGKKGKRVSSMSRAIGRAWWAELGCSRVGQPCVQAGSPRGEQVTLTRGDIAQGLSDSAGEAHRRQA